MVWFFSRDANHLLGVSRLLHSLNLENIQRIFEKEDGRSYILNFSTSLFVSHFSFSEWLRNFKANFHLSNLILIREKEKNLWFTDLHSDNFQCLSSLKIPRIPIQSSNFRILYTFYSSRNCDLDEREAKQRL